MSAPSYKPGTVAKISAPKTRHDEQIAIKGTVYWWTQFGTCDPVYVEHARPLVVLDLPDRPSGIGYAPFFLDAADRMDSPQHGGNQHRWPEHAKVLRYIAGQIEQQIQPPKPEEFKTGDILREKRPLGDTFVVQEKWLVRLYGTSDEDVRVDTCHNIPPRNQATSEFFEKIA